MKRLVTKRLVATRLKQLAFVSAGTALALGMTWAGGRPAQAQYQAPGDPLQQNSFSGESNSDPFSGSGSGQMSGVFDLFHRANLGLSIDAGAFQRQQSESISTEAENFRATQRERLQQIQPTQSDGTPTVPAPN